MKLRITNISNFLFYIQYKRYHFQFSGTNLKATGQYNFIHTKNTEVGVGAYYGRQFIPGGSKPDYGVNVGVKYKF